MSSYAGLLVIPVFAIIGLNGFSKGGGKEGSKEELRRVSGNFFFRVIVFFIQFCLPIAVALTVVKALMPSISDGFGVLLAAGFIGGHGTAAAVGSTLDTLGYHLSLVLVASGFGYLINTKLVARWLPGVPSYTVAFLVAILMFLVFQTGDIEVYPVTLSSMSYEEAVDKCADTIDLGILDTEDNGPDRIVAGMCVDVEVK